MITRVLLFLSLCLASQLAWATPITSYLEMVKVPSVGYAWKAVPLSNSYTNPVIVCTYNLPSIAANEAVVRVQPVGTGFQIKIQQPNDSNAVTAGDVYCTVSEEGSYTYPIKYEAHTVSSSTTNYGSDWSLALTENVTSAPYKVQSYTQPVVTGQVMSYENPGFSAFWSSACTSRSTPPNNGSICIGKHTGQSAPALPNAETLGYFIAEEAEYIMANAYVNIELGADRIAGAASAGAPYQYTLNRNYSYVTATQTAMDGVNGGWAVLHGSNPVSTTLNLSIDEETITGDKSRTHTNEQVAFWTMEPINKTYAELVINEVMYVQTADFPEFIELYAKTAGSTLNYILSSQDGSSQNYYLPDFTVAAGDYVILYSATGTDNSAGNVHHAYTQSSSPPLANTGDDVVLLKPSATDTTILNGSGVVNSIPVDYVSFGAGSTDPVPVSTLGVTVSWDNSDVSRLGGTPAGTSISLTPNANDTDTSVCWEKTNSSEASACPGHIITTDSDSSAYINSLGEDNNLIPIIALKKSVHTIYDPYNGASNPKAIPGSVLEYTITAENSGSAPADNNTIRISDLIPAKTKLCVENSGHCLAPYFVDGTVSSGLALGTVVYSDNGGSSYGYSASGDGEGADSSVTYLSAPTTGQFNALTGGLPSSFSIKFRVVVE